MKKCLPIALLVVATLLSCQSDEPSDSIASKPATPKVLTNENDKGLGGSLSSSYRTSSIYLALYLEQVEQSKYLQDIEASLKQLRHSKRDSLATFNDYNTKNNSYYKNVEYEILKEIKDSVIAKRLTELLDKSKTQYKNRIAKHQQLLKNLDSNTLGIYDLHTALKILTTLPLIEAYQKDHLPSTTHMEGYIKTQEQVIETINQQLK